MRSGVGGVFLLAKLACGPALAWEPSFDCEKATQPDEYAICASQTLSALDRVIASAFSDLELRFGRAHARQVGGPLLEMRQLCGGDVVCIETAQRTAIDAYVAAGARISNDQVAPEIFPE